MSHLSERSWWRVIPGSPDGRGDQLLVRVGHVSFGELTDLCEKRARPGPVTWIAGVVTLAIAVLIAVGADRLKGAAWIGVAITLAVPLVVFVTAILTRPYHLRATYRGRTVRRLPNATKREFDEIRRAVLARRRMDDDPPWLAAQRCGPWTTAAGRTFTAGRDGGEAADVATRRDGSYKPAYGPVDYGSTFHDSGSGHYSSPSF